MLLSTLVEQAMARDATLGWELGGSAGDPDIAGLCLDSRNVGAGDLFLCVPGEVTDGHQFAEAAVEAGAVALMVERWLDIDVAQVLVHRARPAMAWLAAVIARDPSAEMRLVGITGTNGKTTTAHLVTAILEHSGLVTEVLGTLSGVRTTPEAPDLQRTLRQFVDRGVEAVAMEVSSHALVQDRVTGVHFSVGVFTNLSPEHLDFHGSLDLYFEAKALLFRTGMIDAAVVNLDDPRGAELLQRLDVPTAGFSRTMLEDVEMRLDGSSFTWREQRVQLALPGLFNLDNAMAAAEATRFLGLPDAVIAAGLSEASQVPGRFEVVVEGAGATPTVIVDYSHTPAGIEQVLRSVREIAPAATLCVVFGAGGDRDREKRPLMGAAASAHADHLVVTSDDPRSEDPDTIIAEVVAGIDRCEGVDVVADRRQAIVLALDAHGEGDVIVVAGKGHETTQTVGDRVLDFDDRKVVRELVSGGRP